jgi:ribosomal-protein-alanine N-acetyltransferase
MEIITPRLKLRDFIKADYLAFRDMDARVEMHTFERVPPSEDETRETLEAAIRNQVDIPRTTYKLAITVPPDNTVRGLIKLTREWEAIRQWEVGWAVHPQEWGRGYATEAAWFAMDWAFKELMVHRVVAYCHADNMASVRVMQKLGMQPEGRLRETRWLNMQWCDEYVYAILEREWMLINNLIN